LGDELFQPPDPGQANRLIQTRLGKPSYGELSGTPCYWELVGKMSAIPTWCA